MTNQYVIPLSWRNATLVVGGGALLWILPWLAWPLGNPVAQKGGKRTTPVFRYVRTAQGLDGSAWSPVLMPFPTPYGFSKKATMKELPNKSVVSVLKPKVSEPVYLSMESDVSLPSQFRGGASLRATEFDPEATTKSIFPKVVPSATASLRFEAQESLTTRQFEAPAVHSLIFSGMDDQVVSVMASVEIDRLGRVQHVFLDQPSGLPTVDSAIVRGLRAGKGQPGSTNAWGWVKLYYWKNSPEQKE
ncbi:MAG: hypothetical protein WCO42_04060 [bacterium]